MANRSTIFFKAASLKGFLGYMSRLCESERNLIAAKEEYRPKKVPASPNEIKFIYSRQNNRIAHVYGNRNTTKPTSKNDLGLTQYHLKIRQYIYAR